MSGRHSAARQPVGQAGGQSVIPSAQPPRQFCVYGSQELDRAKVGVVKEFRLKIVNGVSFRVKKLLTS